MKSRRLESPIIAAIVLAAGSSTRMGRPKALLPYPPTGRTFAGELIQSARDGGISEIVVVGRPGDEALQREVEANGARFVPNPTAYEGQLSSLLAGLEAVNSMDLAAVVVMPVDTPGVGGEVVSRLVGAAAASAATILRASHGGSHGHPVLFKKEVFEELRSASPSAGARAVVRADPARVLDIEVATSGVAEDVDTPEDYERMFGRRL